MNITDNISGFYTGAREMCYVDCEALNNRILEFQSAYEGIVWVLLSNIIFFMMLYAYLIAYKQNFMGGKHLDNFFTVLKFYSFYVLALDLFYLYLFVM